MQVFINGKGQEVPDDLNMTGLVDLLGLSGKRLAIESNDDLVPRSRFESHQIAPGDRIEIVQAIGGG
jgi:sulfur carrier protein